MQVRNWKSYGVEDGERARDEMNGYQVNWAFNTKSREVLGGSSSEENDATTFDPANRSGSHLLATLIFLYDALQITIYSTKVRR